MKYIYNIFCHRVDGNIINVWKGLKSKKMIKKTIVILHVDDEWFVRTGALYDFKL